MATATTLPGSKRETETRYRAARLLSLWPADFIRSRGGKAGFAALLLVLCFLPFWAGPMMQYVYSHDAFIFLDGAWRMLHHQRPQLDFSTNLGPVVFLFTALGLLLTHGGGHALQLAHALMGVLVAGFAYTICFRRLPQIPGALLCLFLVLVAMAPYNTGEFPLFLTSGMLYNRIGYALLGVVIVEALVPPVNPTSRAELIGGLVSGVILSLLLFMKVTYAVAGVVLLLLLWPCRSHSRSRLVGLAAALAVCVLLGLIYLRFDIPTLRAEYALSAGAKLFVPSGILGLFLANFEPILLLLALVAVTSLISHVPFERKTWWIFPWAALVTGAVAFMILASNHQYTGDPLSASLGIVIAGLLIRLWHQSESPGLQFGKIALGLGLLAPAASLALPTVTGYTFSILKSGIRWKGTTPEVALEAPAVRDMTVRDEPPFFNGTGAMISRNYGKYLNDGFDLLRRYSSSDESVMSLDFSNAFSYALQRPPQSGGTTCLQAGVTFSRKHFIPAPRLFGDVRLVMLPKWFSDDSIPNPIHDLYGPTLQKQFSKVAESAYWVLLRRNS